MSGGYEAVVDLLSEENGIDIISCATDTIAAGAIEALIAQSKKAVPESRGQSSCLNRLKRKIRCRCI